MSKLFGPVPAFTGNDKRNSNDRRYFSTTKAGRLRPKQSSTRIPRPIAVAEDIPLKDLRPKGDQFKPNHARPAKPSLKRDRTNELFSFPRIPGWRDYSPAMLSLDNVQKQQARRATINHLDQISSQPSSKWSLSKAFQAPIHWLRSLLSR